MRTPQGQVPEPSFKILRFAHAECSKTAALEVWRGGTHEDPPGPGFRVKPQMPRFAHAECSKTPITSAGYNQRRLGAVPALRAA